VPYRQAERNAVPVIGQPVGTLAVHRRDIRVERAQVGVFSRKRAGHVVDVTATTIVVDDRTYRQGVLDQRQIEGGIDAAVGIAAGGDAVAAFDVTLGFIQLGFVGDVANGAGLGATTEQRALRTFE